MKSIEHGYLVKEATLKMIAEKHSWLGIQSFAELDVGVFVGVNTSDEVLQKVKAQVWQMKPGEWILAKQFDPSLQTGKSEFIARVPMPSTPRCHGPDSPGPWSEKLGSASGFAPLGIYLTELLHIDVCVD
jgi:hypothetical protein